jgi:hypothetical protein
MLTLSAVATPQLMRVEDDRIKPLRLLAESLRVCVREHMHTPYLVNLTRLSPSVTRQARMVANLGSTHPHPVTNRKTRSRDR